MTEAPKTPSAANVFRSAWIPAPPEESEPAMVSAIGVVIAGLAQMLGLGPWVVLQRFRAKWIPVRVKKTRQNKRLEPGSNSIRTDKALGRHQQRHANHDQHDAGQFARR